jgi:photosystem II stability/assembly factor-like uncharacterized protein
MRSKRKHPPASAGGIKKDKKMLISKAYFPIFGFMAFLLLHLGILNAQENQWISNGPQGGSIVTIAINPLNNAMLYTGTVQNGIYKSINSGNSWIHLHSDTLYPTQRVIAIHPTAPDTLYAATYGGIFKSTNAGVDWIRLLPPRDIHEEYRALAINPDHPNIIFAGGVFDQWRSTDSGESWEQLNIPRVSIDAFAIDPHNSSIMYLASGSVSDGMGIWKSLDMGQSWFPVHNNIDSSSDSFGTDVFVDPVNSNIVYFARYSAYSVLRRCLSKSSNSGLSWVDITPPGLISNIIQKVRVAPHIHNIIFATTAMDGVLRSTDGGATWQRKNNGLDILQTCVIEIDPISGMIYLGTINAGIYRSTDEGESWEPISANINAATCRSLSINLINPNQIFTAANNGLFESDDAAQTWRKIDIAIPIHNSPSAVMLDKIDPRIIFMTVFQASPENYIEPAGIYRSTDAGISWAFLNSGLDTALSFSYIAISYSETGQRRIFVSAQGTYAIDIGGLYYSDDMGENWILCQGGLPAYIPFSVVEVAPSNFNVIAVGEGGAYDQRLFVSTDRGLNWAETTPLPPPIYPYPYITSIAFDLHDANHFYISSDYLGLYETTDLGHSWINKTSGLPPDPQDPTHIVISGIAINPQNPQNIFVQPSWRGVYQSHDGGSTWVAFNAGLDTAMAYGKIYFTPNDTSRLFMASDHSLWSIHRTLTGIEDNAPVLPEKITFSSYPNPFNALTTISYALPQASNLTVEIFDITGRKIQTLFSGYQEAGEHSTIWDAGQAASGVYFYRIKAGEFSSVKKCVLLR